MDPTQPRNITRTNPRHRGPVGEQERPPPPAPIESCFTRVFPGQYHTQEQKDPPNLPIRLVIGQNKLVLSSNGNVRLQSSSSSCIMHLAPLKLCERSPQSPRFQKFGNSTRFCWSTHNTLLNVSLLSAICKSGDDHSSVCSSSEPVKFRLATYVHSKQCFLPPDRSNTSTHYFALPAEVL